MKGGEEAGRFRLFGVAESKMLAKSQAVWNTLNL